MINIKAGDLLDLAKAVLQSVPVNKELLRRLGYVPVHFKISEQCFQQAVCVIFEQLA